MFCKVFVAISFRNGINRDLRDYALATPNGYFVSFRIKFALVKKFGKIFLKNKKGF